MGGEPQLSLRVACIQLQVLYHGFAFWFILLELILLESRKNRHQMTNDQLPELPLSHLAAPLGQVLCRPAPMSRLAFPESALISQ